MGAGDGSSYIILTNSSPHNTCIYIGNGLRNEPSSSILVLQGGRKIILGGGGTIVG